MFSVVDWGTIDFEEAWRRQRELSDAILLEGAPDTLALCEHPPVITLGRTTKQGSVVTHADLLRARGINVIEIDRGGEATVHVPGQLVGYPVFNLERTKPDLHWFLRTIEQSVIDALSSFGLPSGRVHGLTGVWINEQRKICAIGIHCRRWVTTHGFALNVNNDLGLFSEIIPCGIVDRGVTSLSKELGRPVDFDAVKSAIVDAFTKNFLEVYSQ